MSNYLSRLLEKILGLFGIQIIHPISKVPARAFLSVWLPFPKGVFVKGGVMNLPVGEQTVVHLNVLNAAGQSITDPVVPAPVWTSSDPTLATVTPAADGMSATAVGVKVSTSPVTINVVVTSNPDGSPKVTASGSVTVTAGEPASASLTFDPPTPVATPVTP